MVTDLVLEKRKIGATPVETIDARRLHTFLGVGTDFKDWIARRIADYAFQDGADFCSYLSESTGGRRAKEYALTLDMAKELSMVERNAKGKEARRYFIECERRAKMPGISTGPRIDVARESRLQMAHYLRLARLMGLNGNQATLSANRATAMLTGVDMLGLMGQTHLTAPQNEALLSPTDIARRFGLGTPQAVNLKLCLLGLQASFRDGKGHVYYEPTEAGKAAGGVMQDTGKKHGSGTPVRQLRWASSVISHLEEADG
ncbi:antA/AntB antirepressor family protein [Sphingomonas sp. PB4P5]|uniref:antA/AntB antirepressor family protein n=1 Tax=Parasphingomonas puruogangriensis TaxID=3096155 RepID=UPI002FC789DB